MSQLHKLSASLAVVVAFGVSAAVGISTTADTLTKKKVSPTYVKDIAPIIEKNCSTCHRAGEVAPFNLLTFQDAQKRAKQIAQVTKSRNMPPWKADSHGEFYDERHLSEDQIKTIGDWVAAGSPLGDPKLLPPSPNFKSGWKLGPPDKIIGLSEPYQVGAEGRDVYRCFVIPTGTDVDQYVSALEVKPGNRAIVHHVIAYIDTTGAARKLDEADAGPGYSSSGGGPGFIPSAFLGGWAPGNEPRLLPDGIGNLIPKGSDIVLEVHYHKDGKPESDQTKIGLYYCKKPVQKHIRSMMVINPFFKIPAGAENHPVNALTPVFNDITVLSVTPHMHLLGRDMKVFIENPENVQKQLVNVPDWDFNWQNTYTFKDPLKVANGSRVKLVSHYDNSARNFRNPNKSPRDVTWGEQTTDEMCIAFVGYTIDKEDLLNGKAVESSTFGRRRLNTGAVPK